MFRTERLGGYSIWTFDEPRLDAARAPQFREQVKAAQIGPGDRLLLDLGALKFVDSTGLGALVNLLKLVGPTGALVLARVQPAVRQLLAITKLDRVFRLADSAADAQRMLDE